MKSNRLVKVAPFFERKPVKVGSTTCQDKQFVLRKANKIWTKERRKKEHSKQRVEMEFDDDDLPGDANNNSGAAAASRRPNTSRGGDSSGTGSISTEAERPKTGYRTSQSRVGSAQGSSEGRPYSR